MNYNAYMGVLRALVPGAVGYLAGMGLIPQSDVAGLVAAIVAIGAAAWSIVTNYEHKAH